LGSGANRYNLSDPLHENSMHLRHAPRAGDGGVRCVAPAGRGESLSRHSSLSWGARHHGWHERDLVFPRGHNPREPRHVAPGLALTRGPQAHRSRQTRLRAACPRADVSGHREVARRRVLRHERTLREAAKPTDRPHSSQPSESSYFQWDDQLRCTVRATRRRGIHSTTSVGVEHGCVIISPCASDAVVT
jgi:hypothetical protein